MVLVLTKLSSSIKNRVTYTLRGSLEVEVLVETVMS
jgi:hypothetical protein